MSNCIFKKISRMPVSKLKALDTSELQEILKTLHEELKTVQRAVKWVDGIMQLKKSEQSNYK